MTEYELFVPVTRKGAGKLSRLKKHVAKYFGGLTYFPQRNEGFWRFGGVMFEDDVVILRVLSDDAKSARKFLRRLKSEIAQDFNQKDVLIISRRVRTI